MGLGAGLRDADWAAQFRRRGAGGLPARPQVLYRWNLVAGASTAGLWFQPLDGNPRHGVLALYLTDRRELYGAIEILERQGRWWVMPDRTLARALAIDAPAWRGAALLARPGLAVTPDRRFAFFNARLDGATVTSVARCEDGGIAVT